MRPTLAKIGAVNMSFPAWKDMTNEQKLSFLHQWCENLTHKVEVQERTIQYLHERLKTAEGEGPGISE
jgi:hypothetical protein